jgi:hypothetical protein
MPSLVLAALTLAFAVLSIASGATSAQTLDPHVLYEERCAGCHAPHAGEFVPDNLARRGDQIVGRDSGKELRPFLAGGHGRLEPLEVDVMVAHLAAILEGCFANNASYVTTGRSCSRAGSSFSGATGWSAAIAGATSRFSWKTTAG